MASDVLTCTALVADPITVSLGPTCYLIQSRAPRSLNRIYIGFTTDLERRLRQHNSGRGCKQTAGKQPWHLVHTVEGISSGLDAKQVRTHTLSEVAHSETCVSLCHQHGCWEESLTCTDVHVLLCVSLSGTGKRKDRVACPGLSMQRMYQDKPVSTANDAWHWCSSMQ